MRQEAFVGVWSMFKVLGMKEMLLEFGTPFQHYDLRFGARLGVGRFGGCDVTVQHFLGAVAIAGDRAVAHAYLRCE